uniref:Uncharacterized protein n=1 Tax=Anguilla anguilla TaxID=7936 RepID=A0A0E9VIX4_ANGAN
MHSNPHRNHVSENFGCEEKPLLPCVVFHVVISSFEPKSVF